MTQSCLEIISDYGLRSIGIGERLLPRSDFTLCHEFTLIGSGLIWNLYFGLVAMALGFFLATALALAKTSPRAALRKPAEWFIFVFRGSPLFIQFFLAYELLVLLPRTGINIFGLTIETVSRMITQLQGAGVVRFESCRRFRICDREALLELAAA